MSERAMADAGKPLNIPEDLDYPIEAIAKRISGDMLKRFGVAVWFGFAWEHELDGFIELGAAAHGYRMERENCDEQNRPLPEAQVGDYDRIRFVKKEQQ